MELPEGWFRLQANEMADDCAMEAANLMKEMAEALDGIKDVAEIQVASFIQYPLSTGMPALRDWQPILTARKKFKEWE